MLFSKRKRENFEILKFNFHFECPKQKFVIVNSSKNFCKLSKLV